MHETRYPEYREVKTLELMTAVLPSDLVSGDPRMLDGANYLRCVEPSPSGGRVCVGGLNTYGLKINDDVGVNGPDSIGRALGRKL